MAVCSEMSPGIQQHLANLIDVGVKENLEKFDNWLKPFVNQMGVGYFNIDVACLIFDQFIISNTRNKIYYILIFALNIMKDQVLRCQ